MTCCGGAAPAAKPAAKPADKKAEAAPATIVVSLPADAKLFVDDAQTSSTSAVRTFESPALETGKESYYTLKAEIVRDGKPVTTSKRIAVRGGEQTSVSFDFASVAQR